MKFTYKDMGEAAEASSAEGKSGRELLTLAALAVVTVVAIYFAIGVIVDFAVPRISINTEKRIFSSVHFGNEKKDDASTARIRGILDQLMSDAEIAPYDYSIVMIEEETPNAVAFPGGTIGVTTGLFDALSAEDDISLAFVLGHELGHYKHRDHLRGMGRGIGLAVCVNVVFAGAGSANSLTSSTVTLLDRKYSRSQEEKADRFSVELIHRVYGDTNGVERLFEHLEKIDKMPAWAYMFATHPSHRDRIEKLRSYSQELSSE